MHIAKYIVEKLKAFFWLGLLSLPIPLEIFQRELLQTGRPTRNI